VGALHGIGNGLKIQELEDLIFLGQAGSTLELAAGYRWRRQMDMQNEWIHEENGPFPAGRLNGSRLRIRRQHTFQQEYLGFLKPHKLGFDDKYRWD
jgi:hypothetical protein